MEMNIVTALGVVCPMEVFLAGDRYEIGGLGVNSNYFVTIDDIKPSKGKAVFEILYFRQLNVFAMVEQWLQGLEARGGQFLAKNGQKS
uniref:PNPLA domain-containing protein n=1 Tax=Panagrellus redivivus TaxID=6233 RepID=A0A7E4VM35_PANRE